MDHGTTSSVCHVLVMDGIIMRSFVFFICGSVNHNCFIHVSYCFFWDICAIINSIPVLYLVIM